MAIKSIKPGEEITYHYGRNYFDTFIKPVGCKCPSCTRKRAMERAEARAAKKRAAARAQARAAKQKSEIKRSKAKGR